MAKFGRNFLKEFDFREDWTNMNHGSFGAVPKKVRECFLERQQLVDSSPDLFVRYQYGPLLQQSRKQIADFVHAPESNVVLVPNATIGMDTILRNIPYRPSDHILIFSTIYGTVERTVLELSESTSVNFSRIPIRYPLSHAEIVDAFLDKVNSIRQAGQNVKVAVFDVISFQPGVRMPFESLISACRDLDIISCVDGAHCLGHLPVDLPALDPDFFVGNLHKWLFTPRGCAIIYAPRRTQSLIHTSYPTSWGFVPRQHTSSGTFKQQPGTQTAFERLFESFGTMDYSQFLCIGSALDFRKTACGGEEAIQKYSSWLAREGGKTMAAILGTEVLDDAAGDLTRDCCMVNIRLPLDSILTPTTSYTLTEHVTKSLTEFYKTYVPVFEHAEHLWARVSAQVYLELDDFVRLGKALKEVCAAIVESAATSQTEVRLAMPQELSTAIPLAFMAA